MFDGLHLYEIVLGALGVIFFLALLTLVVRQVWTDRPYTQLLIAMAVPGIMIAWPSIQSINVTNDTLVISKTTQALRDNPTDTNAREELKKRVASVGDRPIADPVAATSIAEAKFVLGDAESAETAADRVLRANPQAPAALNLKRQIVLSRKIPELTRALEQSPDPTIKVQLEAATQQAVEAKSASPKLLKDIGRAQRVTAAAEVRIQQLPQPAASAPNFKIGTRDLTKTNAIDTKSRFLSKQ